MSGETLNIASRFCGPPSSANGGYVAGRLASYVGRSAEVTLKSPPPLDMPLTVVLRDGAVELLDQDRLLAVARAATPERHVLPGVDQGDATAAAGRTFAASA
ncbi:MAG: hypothetical protein WBN23_12575, partial [Woeseia sp.]